MNKTNQESEFKNPNSCVATAPEPSKPSPQEADTSGIVIYPTTQVDQSSGPLSLREAVARYLVLRVSEGLPEDGDTYSHINKHLMKRLCSTLGDQPLRNIRADHLRSWASALTNERTGKPLEKLTKRHHLIACKTFFRRCWREGWIEKDPTMPIVLPSVEERDISIIPVQTAFNFFKINRDHRAVARLALEAFGGLRYTSAGKIVKADIKFSRRGIEMPSRKHKSTKRRYRQGQPPCLWAWLTFAPEDCWAVTLRQYREEKKEMCVMGGLRPMILKTDADRLRARDMKNIWRRSFASYLLAKEKDFAPISYLMQHVHSVTTEVYEGRADELDAYRYFSITPASVLLTWEEFCQSTPTVPPAFPAIP